VGELRNLSLHKSQAWGVGDKQMEPEPFPHRQHRRQAWGRGFNRADNSTENSSLPVVFVC
jgi:hypothetical protein